MLRAFSDIRNFSLAARDGEIGKVKDLYFDDQSWTVRYVVVDTGGWLTGRKVLLGPQALGMIDRESRLIAVHLTKEGIEKSPAVATDQPVSRQHEEEWHRYYGYPGYWMASPGAIAFGGAPPLAVPGPADPAHAPEEPRGDPHLRSTQEVTGYTIHATDGDIGHVDDFIVDDDGWKIRYLILSRGWLSGRKVAISPEWIQGVSWEMMQVSVPLLRETIKGAPEWEDSEPTREFEQRLHDYYGRCGYWPIEE